MKKKESDRQFVYSTNPDFEPEREENQAADVPAGKQYLRIFPDKKNRNGKIVTVISGFQGSLEGLTALEKKLKSHCGAGGTVKDGEILIQGQVIQKVAKFLEKEGFRYKISGI